MAKPTTYAISLGDTFLVRYRLHLKADLKSFGGTGDGTPLTPTAATVRLVNIETQTDIPLGAGGQLGVEAAIDGNEVTYLIPASKLAAAGKYRAYTQFTLPDGQRKTENVQFSVVALT